MKGEISSIDCIDFYDYEQLEKLQESRARKWLKLFFKAKQGEPKAIEAIKKHETEDRILRVYARMAGYHWT